MFFPEKVCLLRWKAGGLSLNRTKRPKSWSCLSLNPAYHRNRYPRHYRLNHWPVNLEIFARPQQRLHNARAEHWNRAAFAAKSRRQPALSLCAHENLRAGKWRARPANSWLDVKPWRITGIRVGARQSYMAWREKETETER